MTHKPLMLDLFAGLGGASEEFVRAGWDDLGPDRVREWERESGLQVLQAPLESEVRRQERIAKAAGVDRVH